MRVPVLTTLAVMVLLAGTAEAAEKVIDKKFEASLGGTLTVDTDQGTLVVVGTKSNEVVIHVLLSGTEDQLRDFDVALESNGKSVTVRGRRRDDWWLDLSWLFGGGKFRARFEIQMPTDYHLELRTSGGHIEASSISGSLHGHTSGGHLTLASLSGDIDLSTSGGHIDARRLTGNARLRTSGGSITIADSKVDLNARTSGGAIRLQEVQGRIDARTSGGSIEAHLLGPNRGVTLGTSGGGIRVDVPSDFKADLDAYTSGGSVYCELPLTTRGGNDGRKHNSLYGDLNGGGETLSLHTSGGSIRIRARE